MRLPSRRRGTVPVMQLFGLDPAYDRLQIRALRATPSPRAAADEMRRRVFSAALGQFDELLTAAAAVGPASRPLPLYYALNQAGRAIAASRQLADREWRPSARRSGNPPAWSHARCAPPCQRRYAGDEDDHSPRSYAPSPPPGGTPFPQGRLCRPWPARSAGTRFCQARPPGSTDDRPRRRALDRFWWRCYPVGSITGRHASRPPEARSPAPTRPSAPRSTRACRFRWPGMPEGAGCRRSAGPSQPPDWTSSLRWRTPLGSRASRCPRPGRRDHDEAPPRGAIGIDRLRSGLASHPSNG